MLKKITRILGIYALAGIIIIFSIGFFSGFVSDLIGVQFNPPPLEGTFRIWCNSVGCSAFAWIILKPIQFSVKLLSNRS